MTKLLNCSAAYKIQGQENIDQFITRDCAFSPGIVNSWTPIHLYYDTGQIGIWNSPKKNREKLINYKFFNEGLHLIIDSTIQIGLNVEYILKQ